MSNTGSLIVLHIAFVTNNFTSGVSTVVPQYLNAQAGNKDIKVALLNLATDQLSTAQFPVFFQVPLKELPAPFSTPSLVVFHEIYRPEFPKLSAELIKRSIPYIITPHGSLTAIAQKQKHLAKSLLNVAFYNRFLQNAECIHFLSEKEATSSASFNYKKMRIIPNGVNIPEINPIQKKLNVASFVGRLDIEVKGLDLLINSLPPIAEELKALGAGINIYGPDDNGSIEKLTQLIHEHQLGDLVSLKGPISGQEKAKALRESLFYIQLSRTEGFPTSVLEALGYGLPIIVTEGTAWKNLANDKGIGIGVESDLGDISRAILTLFKSTRLRNTMASAAREYVVSNYQWQRISEQQISLYQEIIRGVSR